MSNIQAGGPKTLPTTAPTGCTRGGGATDRAPRPLASGAGFIPKGRTARIPPADAPKPRLSRRRPCPRRVPRRTSRGQALAVVAPAKHVITAVPASSKAGGKPQPLRPSPVLAGGTYISIAYMPLRHRVCNGRQYDSMEGQVCPSSTAVHGRGQGRADNVSFI